VIGAQIIFFFNFSVSSQQYLLIQEEGNLDKLLNASNQRRKARHSIKVDIYNQEFFLLLWSSDAQTFLKVYMNSNRVVKILTWFWLKQKDSYHSFFYMYILTCIFLCILYVIHVYFSYMYIFKMNKFSEFWIFLVWYFEKTF